MPSSSPTLTDLTGSFLEEVQALLVRKNADYRTTNDALAGFNQTAEVTGLSFEQVWGVFIYKHVRAIMNYVTNGGDLQDEGIRSRLSDVAAYSAILAAKLEIDRRAPHAPQREDERSYTAPAVGSYWRWNTMGIYDREKLLITDVRQDRVYYTYTGGSLDGVKADLAAKFFLEQARPV